MKLDGDPLGIMIEQCNLSGPDTAFVQVLPFISLSLHISTSLPSCVPLAAVRGFALHESRKASRRMK